MPRLAFVIVSLLTLVGCSKTNPDYCPNGVTANGANCIDAPPGTGDHCANDDFCLQRNTSLPFCDKDVNGGTCVQCTSDHTDVCMGSMPHCDLVTGTCVACIDDKDCGGTGVCLPTGGCADPGSIIHAISSGGSTMPTCGGIGAGNACTLDTALALPKSATKNVIKLDDAGPYTNINGFTVNTDASIEITIDARGATLQRTMDGAIFTVNSTNQNYKAVTILGGTIEGATGGGGGGIQCNANASLNVYDTILTGNEEAGLYANNCTLTMVRADIHGNSTKVGSMLFPGVQSSGGSTTVSQSSFTANRGGGIVISNAKFEIIGNVFLRNGDSTGNFGGVSINTTGSGNRLEFNTISQNKSDVSSPAGVQCTLSGFTAQNNIIWNNNSALGVAGIQINGNCSYTYSDLGPAVIPTINDPSNTHNNLNVAPPFMNDLTDLHLQPVNMVRGKANPNADLTGTASKDMDGKPRVQPADLGAYIAPPQ